MIAVTPATSSQLASDMFDQITGPLDYATSLIDAIELCLDSMIQPSGKMPPIEVSLITEWRTCLSLLNLARDQVRTALQAADQADGLS